VSLLLLLLLLLLLVVEVVLGPWPTVEALAPPVPGKEAPQHLQIGGSKG
jgi:hypothetical protein